MSGSDRKRKIVTTFQRYVLNPIMRSPVGLLFGVALLETTGRRSGRSRRTPLGAHRNGQTVWIVAEHGRRANYVRNIEVNPRVRIRVRGRWRDGTATVMADDDARRRLRLNPNDLLIRLVGTDPLTIRIDLDQL